MRQERTRVCLYGFVLLALTFSGCAVFNFGEPKLVDHGQAQADIVISAMPTRAVKLAALELRTYIEKISGAKLAIATAPGPDVPVHIYVGRSAETDRLKITDEGLKCGAFRMVSGKDWLVLLGHDKDCTPLQYDSKKEWDERTGEHWGNPAPGRGGYSATVGLWEFDERGTLNAVYEFLRGLGVRWYMPGDLGEVIPERKTISLVPVDKTVKPDFPYRNLGDYSPAFRCGTRDAMLYKLRIGVDATMGVPGPHGLNNVNGRDEVKKAHPEYFALLADGTRKTGDYYSPCVSSEGLFEATVKYARTVFDIYPDLQYLSIMPNDGFSMCQCELCKGKYTPQRGSAGEASYYVWDFTERVARELYKTHPDRKLIYGAYHVYTLPPEKIAKLSPNVMVQILEPRKDFINPGEHARALELRNKYLDKLAPGNLLTYCHYLYSRPGREQDGLPVYFPHAIAEDLHSLKGKSQGEFIELTQGVPDFRDMHAPGFNHLNVYVTARYYWDADQNIDALLDEYYEKFYGPAAKEMKAFIEYSEKNWQFMPTKLEPVNHALDLLESARKAAGDGTVYSKRIGLICDYVRPLKDLQSHLAIDRKDVPQVRTWQQTNDSEIVIDGCLDEPKWKECEPYALSLSELETGRTAFNGTSFMVLWENRAVYFGIRCNERDMKNLNITTTQNDDSAIFKGDYVDVLLETQGHSYYQIAVNPAGALFDADMKGGSNLAWSSNAKVAVHKGDTFWSVEMRIPFGDAIEGGVDPMKSVEGRSPTSLYPWFINLCRQRARPGETERSAWSPTGENNFYVPAKFGEVFIR